MFTYTFKPTPEILWALLQIAVGAAAGFIVTNPLPVQADLKLWIVALAAAIARPVFAFIFGNKVSPTPEPAP